MPKFNNGTRLQVPGQGNTQGVVIDSIEGVAGFPVYTLRWLDEGGETHTGSCGEGDLVAAQPDILQLAAVPALSIELSRSDIKNWVRHIEPAKPKVKKRKR